MPTPFKLKVKTDIWTSNTDQKLQILEQILVLFNPSLEVQTTDNYIDWTSLSVIYLNSVNFSSRTIPQGGETDIDIASLEFEMPIWISPPAKVKKLGVVRAIVANMFGNTGDASALNDLIYNDNTQTARANATPGNLSIVMLKMEGGNANDYAITVFNPGQTTTGTRLSWETVFEKYGGYKPGISRMLFKQPNNFEIVGTIAVNPLDASILVVSLDTDTISSNSLLTEGVQPTAITSGQFVVGTKYMIADLGITSQGQWNTIAGTTGVVYEVGSVFTAASAGTGTGQAYKVISSIRDNSKGTVDAIINPYNFDPVITWNGKDNFPVGLRYLMLDDVNPNNCNEDGPDAWKNLVLGENGSYDPWIKANSIIEWDGTKWNSMFDPDQHLLKPSFTPTYITNLRTGIQYKWDGIQWLKSFEGEYKAGSWRFDLDPL
jgi:hypothetical protein